MKLSALLLLGLSVLFLAGCTSTEGGQSSWAPTKINGYVDTSAKHHL